MKKKGKSSCIFYLLGIVLVIALTVYFIFSLSEQSYADGVFVENKTPIAYQGGYA